MNYTNNKVKNKIKRSELLFSYTRIITDWSLILRSSNATSDEGAKEGEYRIIRVFSTKWN